MNEHAPCLLYTQDAELAQRIRGFLGSAVELKHVSDPGDLKLGLEQIGPAVLLLDVRVPNSRDLLPEIGSAWPQSLVIALGVSRSDPILEAEALDVYAIEDLDFDGRRLQSLVGQALEHIRLSEEVHVLRERIASSSSGWQETRVVHGNGERTPALRHFFPALRHFDNVEALVAGIVDGIAGAGIVLRAGIFACSRDGKTYRLKAARGCRDETRAAEFAADSPLIRWMETNAQLVSRAGLRHSREVSERMMLRKALDAMGAELIAPLQGRQRLIGWLFLGRRATGRPFDETDLQDIMVFAEHVSTTLENAMLYEEITLQKTLAETLLHSIPTGIVAAGEDGTVQWFSDAAEKILGTARDDVINQPVETLGSRLADLLRRSLRGESVSEPHEWVEPLTKRCLSVRTARLINKNNCLGVVAFIHDLTRERMVNEKQKEAERATFWTELAAAMSHEIRNPMVAVNTFMELLPEKYSDPEFRDKFSALVTKEVKRVNGIIDEIERFAHAPALVFKTVSIGPILAKARATALAHYGPSNNCRIEVVIDEHIPQIHGDGLALLECFTNVITNAIEATDGQESARVSLAAKRTSVNGRDEGIRVTVEDNGNGIRQDIRDKVFSPFCTTKVRGLGLGLPISKRIVTDHNGQIDIHSMEKGAIVSVLLPAGNHEENK